ncbi:MAG TPA: hypothetical protein DCK93_13705 [Blastocatellia bacterium]|nr:hypothetical protein [Blastocatellia bacterium]HAF23937.1 hypothetical protein [Blastocatellia bacterium]
MRPDRIENAATSLPSVRKWLCLSGEPLLFESWEATPRTIGSEAQPHEKKLNARKGAAIPHGKRQSRGSDP